MDRKVLIVAVVVVVAAIGVASAFVLGVGPASGGGNSEHITDFPTASSGGGGSGSASGSGSGDSGGSSGDAAATTQIPSFDFKIKKIENCGNTCRDVTSTIVNQQDTKATGVVVYSRVFAGNKTKSGNKVWAGKKEVGALDPGESFTATKRVKLSYSDAYSVKQKDGWITIQTTIKTDDQVITFVSHRDVL